MNVKALLHDSPPDAHRRRPDTQPWGTHPLRDPRDAPQDPVPQPDANRRPIQPVPSPSSQSPAMASLRPLDAPLQAQPPVQLTQQPVPSRRMPSPPPQSGIWGSDRPGSEFQKEREQPRDLRDRPRDRLPPLLDQPRKKNIAMEVNGPLSGPGVPISGPDDMAARSRSRRPSISGDSVKTEDELRGREPQQRPQERPLREPSRERDLRDRDAWESDMYQRSRDRKPRERDSYMSPYARPPAPEYRQPSGPGVPPTADYRSGPPIDYRGQPPPGRSTPQAELVVLKHGSGTAGPGVPGDRDRERERERERLDRDRALHSPYGVIGERDREREWEREQERINMGMMYPDRDRDRGPPPGMVPLPPPHGHSHSHSHGHPNHSHQHHHREPSGHSHSLHPVPHHQPQHQPPSQHKGPPHLRHSHHVHHPQPQSSSQIQLLPHPHSHPPHSLPHPSQPQHPPSSQPHSPHPGQMHGGPPPPSHPVYRSQPPPPPSSVPGPSGSGMSPHHNHNHHHHQHHPTLPSQQPSHHHPAGPPPPQRQFQNQFHTQFIPGLPQPGSRMGSPVPSLPQQPPSQQQQQQQQQSQQQPQQQPQQQQRSTQSVPPAGSSNGSIPSSSSSSQPHIPPSSNFEPPEAKGISMRLKKPRVGPKEQDRDRALDVDRNGRRTYPDMDELEGAEDAESDIGQAQAQAAAAAPAIVVAVAAEVEEWDDGEEEEEEEVKAKVKVNLGTFVYPKLPFPYFFDLGRGIELCEEGKAVDATVESGEKEGEAVDKELDVKPEIEVEKKESVEEKKGEGTIPVQKREDEMMDVEGEQQKVVDKTAPPTTAPTTTTVKEDPNLLDVETRVTVIIPNGFIPLEKPPRPRIWGGGLIDRTPTPGGSNRRNARGNAQQQQHGRGSAKRTQRKQQVTRPDDDGKSAPVSVAPRRRRRVYTDDSDLFLCALHSGWVTWSGAWAARAQGKDVRLDLRVLKCAGAPGGARWIENVVGREDVVGRFLGGWGERCFNEAGKVRRKQLDADGEVNDVGGDEETSDGEDDGRGLVSAGWGTTHDGSAIEVLGVDFVEKSTARSSLGVGLRNRAQRMYEYSERRTNVLAPATMANGRSPLMRLPGRKRRRGCDWALSYPRRLPNAAVLDVIPEADDDEEGGLTVDCDRSDERAQMNAHTVVFRPGKTGFKYAPATLQELLFPGSAALDSQPPKKRRKMEDTHDVDTLDADSDNTHAPRRPIALLAGEKRYLVSPCRTEPVLRDCKYDVSLVVVESDVEQTAKSVEPPSLRLLQSGVGRASFQFLRDQVIVAADDGEELRVPVVSWHWWGPVVS